MSKKHVKVTKLKAGQCATVNGVKVKASRRVTLRMESSSKIQLDIERKCSQDTKPSQT